MSIDCRENSQTPSYPDLSPYTYRDWPSMRAVGWLESTHTYTQGEVPIDCVDQLARFCMDPALTTLGRHVCDFCHDIWAGVLAVPGRPPRPLGSCVIWVFDAADVVYTAPDLIYHYVTTHHYQPPSVFLSALMSSPVPNTSAYKARYDQICGRTTAP